MRSRFEWGLLTDIQAPDLETREAILRKKAGSENIPVPDEVTSFIAKVIPSNIRELEGALIRVIAYASLTKSPITTDLAADVLKSAVAQAPLHRITIAKIKETVSERHGLTVKEMDNGRRDQRLAAPRQIAMYIATELTDYSLPQIAREFGKKDHTTVMYARDKIKERMQTRRSLPEQDTPAHRDVSESLDAQPVSETVSEQSLHTASRAVRAGIKAARRAATVEACMPATPTRPHVMHRRNARNSLNKSAVVRTIPPHYCCYDSIYLFILGKRGLTTNGGIDEIHLFF